MSHGLGFEMLGRADVARVVAHQLSKLSEPIIGRN